MKLKYFLRGLGVGIIVTTLILCFVYRKNNARVNVVEQAKKMGMVFPEETEEPAEETVQPDVTVPPATPEVTAEPAPVAEHTEPPVPSGAGVQGGTPEATDTPAPTDKPKDKKKSPASGTSAKKNKKSKTFTVRSGLLSSSVAREMKEAGIIDDVDAFDEYMEQSGNSRKIITGTYKIPKGASFEEIAKIITRQK